MKFQQLGLIHVGLEPEFVMLVDPVAIIYSYQTKFIFGTHSSVLFFFLKKEKFVMVICFRIPKKLVYQKTSYFLVFNKNIQRFFYIIESVR